MKRPCLDLLHLKTSKQYEGATLIYRYWFQWQNRRNLSAIVVRIDLLDAEANVVTNTSLRLPKVTITGTLGDGTSVYSGPVFFSIDDVARTEVPAAFEFYTVEWFLKKSEGVTKRMTGPYEDLSLFM